MRRYLFSLAFENSLTPDYVSEKVYQALSAPTIPVYMGPSNYYQFLPRVNSVIYFGHFESPSNWVIICCVFQGLLISLKTICYGTKNPVKPHIAMIFQVKLK